MVITLIYNNTLYQRNRNRERFEYDRLLARSTLNYDHVNHVNIYLGIYRLFNCFIKDYNWNRQSIQSSHTWCRRCIFLHVDVSSQMHVDIWLCRGFDWHPQRVVSSMIPYAPNANVTRNVFKKDWLEEFKVVISNAQKVSIKDNTFFWHNTNNHLIYQNIGLLRDNTINLDDIIILFACLTRKKTASLNILRFTATVDFWGEFQVEFPIWSMISLYALSSKKDRYIFLKMF